MKISNIAFRDGLSGEIILTIMENGEVRRFKGRLNYPIINYGDVNAVEQQIKKKLLSRQLENFKEL